MLLACALLLTLAGAPGAFASTTDELRGEWEFELKCECVFPDAGTESLKGTALISKMNKATGEFAGTTDFFGYPGEFVEELVAKEKPHVTENKLVYTLQITSPAGTFYLVVTEGTVTGGGTGMSGPGVYDPRSAYEEKGSFTATKIRSWAEIEQEEKERKERAEKEKFEREGREKGEKAGREKGEQEGRAKGEQEGREKAEQAVRLQAEQEAAERSSKEAQAKTEREAKEKTEKEAAEKAETQAREKAEREAREKVEKEAKQKSEKEAKTRLGGTGQPAVLIGKSFTVAASGQLSLKLTNANGYSVSGALTLSPATASRSGGGAGGTSGGAPSKGKGNGRAKKPVLLAEALYTIASHSTRAVALKLSKSALAELAHRKTLQLVATVTTRAGGGPSSTKTYDITLKLSAAKHG